MPVEHSDSTFITNFKQVMFEATGIVIQRDSEGRNAETSVYDQFNTDPDFVAKLIRMKANRAISYLAAGNHAKFIEEMQDCINYGGFAIVFLNRLTDPGT